MGNQTPFFIFFYYYQLKIMKILNLMLKDLKIYMTLLVKLIYFF